MMMDDGHSSVCVRIPTRAHISSYGCTLFIMEALSWALVLMSWSLMVTLAPAGKVEKELAPRVVSATGKTYHVVVGENPVRDDAVSTRVRSIVAQRGRLGEISKGLNPMG